MSFFPQRDVDPVRPPFTFFREQFGFLPNHILALASLPRSIEAEYQISNTFLFRERALTRERKELILLAMAAAGESRYTAALHYQTLRSLGLEKTQLKEILFDYRQAGLPQADVALLDLALRLGRHPTWVTWADIMELRQHGFGDEHILETVLTISWGGYLCFLSAGLGVKPNFEPPEIPPAGARGTVFRRPNLRRPGEPSGPYIRIVDLRPASFQPFASVRKKWGFVPNLLQAQTLWPDLIDAELRALELWLGPGDVLSQQQKECIFLAVSAANLNTYCVAAHCAILRGLGMPEEQAEQVALDHRRANLSEADKVLLDVCLKLARRPADFGRAGIAVLREQQFTEEQILEAALIVAITSFINTLNAGLGVTPDFDPKVSFERKKLYLFSASESLMKQGIPSPPADAGRDDDDTACVARVQAGDSDAFEELVRCHGRRVYRTLAGILRRDEEVEDAVQDTFMKAFQHIGEFQRRSRFSTWLTRIAVNTGLQRLRGRKEFESLDSGAGGPDEFRPRQVQAWQDDPEQSYTKAEIRELLLKALMRLPLKYRIVVLLRDLQQLSTAETASTLGLEISTVKARLFRGRLMLRERLSSHFTGKSTQRAHG